MGESTRLLRAIPLFAELAAPELKRLGGLLEERAFETNQVISREDGLWEGLYIVRSGKVKLSKRSMERELTMAIMEPGEPLNISALFEGGPNLFTAQAMGPVSVYYLSERHARAFVFDHAPVQKAMLRILNRRVCQLASLAGELSFKEVSARLASWLLAESRERGIPRERGIEIRRDLSLKELAALMGTVRRVLSRSLAELRQGGAIEVASDRIVVLDRERLRAIAERG